MNKNRLFFCAKLLLQLVQSIPSEGYIDCLINLLEGCHKTALSFRDENVVWMVGIRLLQDFGQDHIISGDPKSWLFELIGGFFFFLLHEFTTDFLNFFMLLLEMKHDFFCLISIHNVVSVDLEERDILNENIPEGLILFIFRKFIAELFLKMLVEF